MKKDGQFETYKEALKFIMRLPKKRGVSGVAQERMRKLLAYIGEPEKKLKVVHITGTAGKGSTATLLSGILKASGYKVGTHTSPHLQSVRERTKINGYIAKKSDYLAVVNRVKKSYDKLVEQDVYGKPDYFQFITAVSLGFFVQKKVDIAVVEVGAGGYGDSTNVVIPMVSVITNIGLDHVGTLGDTIEDITRVKAGIIKENSTVVSGVRQPKLESIIRHRATDVGAKIITVNNSAEYKVKKVTFDYVIADIKTKKFNLESVKIGLTGRYQVRNATMAVLVCGVLKERSFRKINEDAVRKGLEDAVVPGRFEVVKQNPPVVLDSAHNKDKAKAFVGLAKKLFNKRDVFLMLGFKADKDYKSTIEEFAKLEPKKVYVTQFKTGGVKSVPIKELLPVAKKLFKNVESIIPAEKCAKKAIDKMEEDDILVITGSMYMVGILRNKWEKLE